MHMLRKNDRIALSFTHKSRHTCPAQAGELLHMGQAKARCVANGGSIGKRRNAGMARVQEFLSGEPPGGHLLRCALL